MYKAPERILLGHGSGGRLSHDLIKHFILPAFANPVLSELHDGARLTIDGARLAFSTDSYVVKPRFFPGGDIGKLAVCGTVNDLAMCGAEPLYLSAGFIVEEGLPAGELQQIIASMQSAALAAGVAIVTGDTKVVEKGAVDGLYINTAGIGRILPGVDIDARRVKPGQTVIVSGYLGDHAIAVMSERHGLTLPAQIVSDCAPLNKLVRELLTAVPAAVTMLRDPTRGGLATTLNEIAADAGVGIILEENAVPVRPEVQAVCEILGFDPLYLANEGKVIVIVEKEYNEQVLAIMRQNALAGSACIIGTVTEKPPGQVALKTMVGGLRLVDMLAGEQLPRIC
ncbi:hydrogenase expression/formation protein HypE [Sporomusa aerivorans]|uniref:hydrogenase expression/formation protein HypE n=1 Tax=Sporomusa aerivorans TaxID=204936 RepID=UPI00352A2A15